MKLQQTSCPHCGAPLVFGKNANQATCEYCGQTTVFDDETVKVEYVNSLQAGYDFEKGRQMARAENPAASLPSKKKKRHTFWWVVGWIFMFPIPATILICRSRKRKIVKAILIVLVWLLYIAIMLIANN